MLDIKWVCRATVLYDRAPSHFGLTSLEEKHEVFNFLSNNFEILIFSDNFDILIILSNNFVFLQLFCRLSLQTAISSPAHRNSGTEDNGKESTLFTCCTSISGGKLSSEDNSNVCKFWLKEERPALILSSTSW